MGSGGFFDHFFDGLECCVERAQPFDRGAEDEANVPDAHLEATFDHEVRELFDKFDLDGNGLLRRAAELTPLLAELKRIGYRFTYANPAILSAELWQEFEKVGLDGIGFEDFRSWFRSEVISNEENIRILLLNSRWVQGLYRKMHRMADENGDGTVNVKELRKAIKRIYRHLGEPAPSNEEIVEVAAEMMEQDDGDGELSPAEFRAALIELMVKMYCMHFNESMNNPHSRHSIKEMKKQKAADEELNMWQFPPTTPKMEEDKWETGSVDTASSRLSRASPQIGRPASLRLFSVIESR